MSVLYRTLLVGIGATGRHVIEQVKQTLAARYPTAPAGVPFVSYLVIDEHPLSDDSPLIPNEYLRLDTMGMAQYLEERCLRDPKFVENLGLSPGTPLGFGTRTDNDLQDTRLGWHLVFEREAPAVRGALLNQLERLFQTAVWGRPEDKGFDLESGTRVNVLIVAGIDEMFGSSVIIGFLELLQNLPFFRFQDREYRSTVVLTTLNGLSDPKSGALTYAALAELNVKLLDDLRRPLPKDATPYYPYRTPIYEACYLVEATDERTLPIEHEEDRLEMVIEWLAQSVTQPPLQEPTTATFDHVVGAFEPRYPDPNLPYYSGLVHVSYGVPRSELNCMFAGRYGSEILGREGVLAPPPNDADLHKQVAEFWVEGSLEPEELVHFDAEQPRSGPLALDVGEQHRAIFLSYDGTIQLEDMRRVIDDWIDMQRISFLPFYHAKVANELGDILVPRWERLLSKLTQQVGSEPLGGVCAAQLVLADLQERLTAARDNLEKRLGEAQAALETRREQATEARKKAYDALRNQPTQTMLFKFMAWVLATALPLLMGLTWWIVRDLRSVDPLTAFHLATIVSLFGGTLYLYIGLMAVLCAARYLWEWGIGNWRVRRYQHNLPGWTTLGYILIGIPTFAAVCGVLLCRSFDPHALPSELIPLLLLRPEYAQSLVLRGLGSIALVGLMSAAWFSFWHVHAVRRIRETALAWKRSQERLAAQEMVVERALRAKEGYQRLKEGLDRETIRWSERVQRIEEAIGILQQQYRDTRDRLYGRPHQFRQLVVESAERADKIYTSQVQDHHPQEVSQFFGAIALPFLSWLDQPVETMVESLNKYVTERFAPYWASHDVAGLIRDKYPNIPFSEAVERALEWVTRYRPQWSYYAGGGGKVEESEWETFGELRMIAGVGGDDRELYDAVRAFRRVVGDLAPNVYPTGNNYELAITLQRRDLPLQELGEIHKYRQSYLSLREKRPLGWDRPGRKADVFSPERLKVFVSPPLPVVKEPDLPVAVPPSEDIARSAMRALLGVAPGAPREELNSARERVRQDLNAARDGLLNTMSRYRHYAKVQQSKLTGPSWYEILGLPVERSIAEHMVKEAYDLRLKLLDEVYEELLASTVGYRSEAQ